MPRGSQGCSGLGRAVSLTPNEVALPAQDKPLRMLCRLGGCRCWRRRLPAAELLRWQASR